MYAFLPSFGTGEETFFYPEFISGTSILFLYLSMLRYYVINYQ